MPTPTAHRAARHQRREPDRRHLPHLRRPLDQPHACCSRAATSPTSAGTSASSTCIDDERFDTAEKLMANAAEAGEYVAEAFAQKPLRRLGRAPRRRWRASGRRLQTPLEVGDDPQLRANGYIAPGHRRRRQGARARRQPGAVRRDAADDHARAAVRRAHRRDPARARPATTDEIIQLKIDGAVT